MSPKFPNSQPKTLTDFPALAFADREAQLESLHDKFFQPFYLMAEKCDFEASRDVLLSARCWRHDRSHSSVMIVSGRNESHLKYAEVAYDFFTRGYDVWMCDHRGQGFSQRELADTQIGWVDSFQNYVNDVSIFYSRMVAPHLKAAFYVVAHSMGAAVTSLWLAQSRVAPTAVMYTAPMFELILKPYPRVVVAAMVAAGLRSGKEKMYIPGGSEFNVADYGFDLTSSAARRNWNRELFVRHPELRLGSPSYRWLHEALQVPRRLAHSDFGNQLRCPLMVWQAGSDQVVRPNAQKYLHRAAGKCIILSERRSQHELMQETDDIRSRVLSQTLSFFESARHGEKLE
ncbi:MAG: hypothetical protein RIR26_2365 [Pseudomonadota bacterium]|jgi:lysophospholipase